MTRRLALLLILLLCTVAGAQDLKKTMQARYAELNKALSTNNSKALSAWVEKYCTADFSYTSRDKQKYNRKAFLQGLQQQVKATKKVTKSTLTTQPPAVKGNTATVKTATDFEGWIMFDKRQLRLTDKSATTDTWVKSGKEWKLKSVVQTRADTQVYQK